MSTQHKTQIDPLELERYVDGEIKPARARSIAERACREPELAARIDEMQQLRVLLHDHFMAAAEQADFSQLEAQVMQRIEREAPAPLGQRLGAWLGEVFAYRKPVWAPGLALAAAASLALILPGLLGGGSDIPANELLANAGVEVQSIETGTRLAMVYQLPSSRTTIIWIGDSSDEGATP